MSSNSLLAGLNCEGHIHLVLGTNPLAGARCTQSLASGARPILIAETDDVHYGLQAKIDDGTVTWHQRAFSDNDLFTLGREEVDHVVDAVFITSPSDFAARISKLCKRHRIPVNVVDAPQLCTFSLLSNYTDGPLQIGVTTNGRGCKLASRIRREVAASLPAGLGQACGRLGEVRRKIHDHDAAASPGDLDDSVDQGSMFNQLVREDADQDVKARRIRWLSQVCEYWPLKRLAAVTDGDIDALFSAYTAIPACSPSPTASHLGKVFLAGSGPGHPDLLTNATLKAIHAADLILADKLVPSGVLDLIPRRTEVRIARKFPGNADKAQAELLEAAITAARAGKTVLRLKQGDPFIYGRGGEEVAFLRESGVPSSKIIVLPGVTSALSAPLFAGIPPTQRDVADQVLVCTGTGKKGKPPAPPEYVASRTVVFLMALHRIEGLVAELTAPLEEEGPRTLWPKSTPCAVIERASCPDQRVIRTTLGCVVEAIEAEGSRPPGLLVVGKACEALYEMERGRSWAVEDGFRGLDEDEKWLDGLRTAMAA